MSSGTRRFVLTAVGLWLCLARPLSAQQASIPPQHHETPGDPPAVPRPRVTQPPTFVTYGEYVSVQVNVDENGDNIVGDAANEPSIAIDPTDPSRIVIGWRQFDSIESNFREAGWAYSHDGGVSWTFPGVLEEGVFRSDPVLSVDAEGVFYYFSMTQTFEYYLFKSLDGGMTWEAPLFAFGDDKGWWTIDRTGGIGHGNIYGAWTGGDQFTRSTDGGSTFMNPIQCPVTTQFWGTFSNAPDGTLYMVDQEINVVRSINAQNPDEQPTFETVAVDLPGAVVFGGLPNPGGLMGQAWIATGPAGSAFEQRVYALASGGDALFSASPDAGLTWRPALRLNDDPEDNGAYHWFGMLSVAPSGRIDVAWYDTRNDPDCCDSELYYTWSYDGGLTWSPNVPVSPPFDPTVAYPNQNKIGDYCQMISDATGAAIAYAATYNGEQDIYFLRVFPDCNSNGLPDAIDLAAGTSHDCNTDGNPDECDQDELDCNTNALFDECDTFAGTSLDTDADLVIDECDNCVALYNPNQETAWLPMDPPVADSGSYISAALDASERAVAAFVTQDSVFLTDMLQLWHDANGDFRPSDGEIALLDDVGDTGQFPSLAIDPLGRAAVAYHRADAADLRFWYDANGDFKFNPGERVTIDGGAQAAGQHASLAFDDQGRATVAYFKATGADLALWHDDDGDHQFSTGEIRLIDTSGQAGQFASLAIQSGLATVAYYDNGAFNLKLWHDADGDFAADAGEVRTIAAQGDVGQHASLRFDAAGRAAVAFLDAFNAELELWHDADGDFNADAGEIKTIDNSGFVGALGDLAFDTYSRAMVTYYRTSNADLRLWFDADGDFAEDPGERQTIASQGDVGGTSAGVFSLIHFAPLVFFRDETQNAMRLRFHLDWDTDQVCFADDNCPAILNPDQADTDSDGLGDACDTEPCVRGDLSGDGVVDSADVPGLVNVLLDPGNASPDELCRADVNADGDSDGEDIAAFAALLPP